MSIAETPIAAIRGQPALDRRRRPSGRAPLQEGRAARHPHAPRGATGLCRPRHDAGDDPEGALAGAAGSRGVGAGPARACHRRARRHRHAHAVFRSGMAWREHDRSESLDAEFVVRVSRLLHETILALFDGRNNPERTGLLVRLACSNCIAPKIPRPSSRCRMSRAAGAPPTSCSATPPARMRSRRWRATVGTSARTLSRLFSSETQLSFKSWCQRARIAAAIERLSTEANVSVKQLASDLGYASVPAFSHAFRQVTGKTPTEFSRRIEGNSDGRLLARISYTVMRHPHMHHSSSR